MFFSYSAGRLPYATALDVFDYIDKDDDYLPWKAGIDGINVIPSLLTKTRPAQKKISVRYFCNLAKIPTHAYLRILEFQNSLYLKSDLKSLQHFCLAWPNFD